MSAIAGILSRRDDSAGICDASRNPLSAMPIRASSCCVAPEIVRSDSHLQKKIKVAQRFHRFIRVFPKARRFRLDIGRCFESSMLTHHVGSA
jgi:hypothetical protein